MNRYTLYELTSAQKLLLYSQKFCIKKCVNNIATSIFFNDMIDLDLLKKSIKEAVNRNDAMRLRFTKDGKNIKQYFIDSEDKDLQFMDFSNKSEEEMETTLHKWAGKKFKLYDSSLNRIVMIKSYDGWYGMFMNVHHTSMDSYSIMMFYKDVMEIYFSYKNNTEYPKALSSYKEVVLKELKYEDNSKAKQEDSAFWKEKFKNSPPIYTDIKGSCVLEELRKKTKNPEKRTATISSLIHVKAKHKVFHLDKEMKEKMEQFCLTNKISLQNLIVMGTRTYLSKRNREESDISFNATVARRGTVEEKRCGGTRIICFPFRTIIDPSKTFLEGVWEIRDCFNQHFRHSNFSFMEIINMRRGIYQIGPMESYESLSITYSPVQIKFEHLECRSKWYCNGAASQNLYLTVMHNMQTDGLDYYYEYKEYSIKPEELQHMFQSMYKIIEKGINQPDITIQELLSSKDLEEAINESGNSKTGAFA